MKVKNLMFGGFAAAIFAGVIGDANAATYNLASKGYVDTEVAKVEAEVAKKQDTLTAGTGITMTANEAGETVIDTKPVQIGDETVSVGNAITNITQEITNITNVIGEVPEGSSVQAELEKKVDTATYNEFVADQAQRDKDQDDAIDLIKGGEGGTGGITDLVNRVSTAEGEIDVLQSDKEDVVNKTTSASELTSMSAQDKAKKYTSVAVAEAIAEAAAGVVAGRVDSLETAVGTNTAGIKEIKEGAVMTSGITSDLVGKIGTNEGAIADLQAADITMDGRVDTLETNVGNTPVSDQINTKINELNLPDTYDVKGAAAAVQTAVTDAKYVSAKDLGLGGYLVKSDGQGNVTMLDVAIVNGDGTKDMITDTDLAVTVE